jgi:predicted nucleic acid-binding protein
LYFINYISPGVSALLLRKRIDIMKSSSFQFCSLYNLGTISVNAVFPVSSLCRFAALPAGIVTRNIRIICQPVQKKDANIDNVYAMCIMLEASENTWRKATGLYFELRRKGVTINSPVDCCIARIALEHGAFLLHRNKDFEKISRICPLKQGRFEFR